MAKLSSRIANIISSFYHTLLKLHAIPEFCLSRKKNKKTGKVYLYKQESTSKGRKQTKIKAAQEAHYLELYSERQKLKARLKELKAQYKKLSFHDRRDVRYALACFQHAMKSSASGRIIEKNMFLDGTTRDSKSETHPFPPVRSAGHTIYAQLSVVRAGTYLLGRLLFSRFAGFS